MKTYITKNSSVEYETKDINFQDGSKKVNLLMFKTNHVKLNEQKTVSITDPHPVDLGLFNDNESAQKKIDELNSIIVYPVM